jgi:hypothetical protein
MRAKLGALKPFTSEAVQVAGRLDQFLNLMPAAAKPVAQTTTAVSSGPLSLVIDSTRRRAVLADEMELLWNLQQQGLVTEALYARVVRDLSQKLGKDIALEISGDEVELDRAILEGLSDPLTHLVRNSVDHGLEQPAEREAQGKSPRGTVRLAAAHLAGRVQIEVADDGRGMDPAKLKAKAVEKGLITSEQASRMADNEALHLLFAAVFSTVRWLPRVDWRAAPERDALVPATRPLVASAPDTPAVARLARPYALRFRTTMVGRAICALAPDGAGSVVASSEAHLHIPPSRR